MSRTDVADVLHQIVDMWEDQADIEHLEDGIYNIKASIRIDGDELSLGEVTIK